MKIYKLSRTGIFAALLCIISPFALPFGGVPLTLSVLGVYLSALLLPGISGFWAVLVYILLGLFGLPVFSGFKGGVGVILGPTGGFIAGYALCALVIALLKEKNTLMSLVFGTLAMYAAGGGWYAYVADLSFRNAFIISVLPFVPFDILKLALGLVISKNRRISAIFRK